MIEYTIVSYFCYFKNFKIRNCTVLGIFKSEFVMPQLCICYFNYDYFNYWRRYLIIDTMKGWLKEAVGRIKKKVLF